MLHPERNFVRDPNRALIGLLHSYILGNLQLVLDRIIMCQYDVEMSRGDAKKTTLHLCAPAISMANIQTHLTFLLSLARNRLALLGHALALLGHTLALFGHALALLGHALALLGP